jgi:hypothetical protein
VTCRARSTSLRGWGKPELAGPAKTECDRKGAHSFRSACSGAPLPILYDGDFLLALEVVRGMADIEQDDNGWRGGPDGFFE